MRDACHEPPRYADVILSQIKFLKETIAAEVAARFGCLVFWFERGPRKGTFFVELG